LILNERRKLKVGNEDHNLNPIAYPQAELIFKEVFKPINGSTPLFSKHWLIFGPLIGGLFDWIKFKNTNFYLSLLLMISLDKNDEYHQPSNSTPHHEV